MQCVWNWMRLHRGPGSGAGLRLEPRIFNTTTAFGSTLNAIVTVLCAGCPAWITIRHMIYLDHTSLSFQW